LEACLAQQKGVEEVVFIGKTKKGNKKKKGKKKD
jgi:hypothetical protein